MGNMTRLYTARLENWFVDNKSGCLIGDIYDDENNRWTNGQKIKTSKMQPMSLQTETPKEGALISTMNSTYLLGKKGQIYEKHRKQVQA